MCHVWERDATVMAWAESESGVECAKWVSVSSVIVQRVVVIKPKTKPTRAKVRSPKPHLPQPVPQNVD